MTGGRLTYRVNEIFYSLQGEGARAGDASVFVRFSGCNLRCSALTEGFDCDTEFTSGRAMTAAEIVAEATALLPDTAPKGSIGVIFTGGEPMLQLDQALVELMRGVRQVGELCLESNGTHVIPVEFALDHVVVSPKTAEHTIRADEAGHAIHELRYVRRQGMAAPRPRIETAHHHFISPAFQADGSLAREDLAWCVQLCKDHPRWALSMQLHKLWGVR